MTWSRVPPGGTGWTMAGRLALMSRPSGGAALPGALRALRDRGVDTLVNALTGADQVDLDLVGEPALAVEAGLSYRSFPIQDFGVPSRDALAELAAALAGELSGGRFVMVHCRGGVGRSGLIACATLIALGAGAGEAMAAVSRARGQDVPETEPQRRMLRELSKRRPY